MDRTSSASPIGATYRSRQITDPYPDRVAVKGLFIKDGPAFCAGEWFAPLGPESILHLWCYKQSCSYGAVKKSILKCHSVAFPETMDPPKVNTRSIHLFGESSGQA